MAGSARPRIGFTRTEIRTVLVLATLLVLGLVARELRFGTLHDPVVEVEGLSPVDSADLRDPSPEAVSSAPRGSGSLAPSPSPELTSALPASSDSILVSTRRVTPEGPEPSETGDISNALPPDMARLTGDQAARIRSVDDGIFGSAQGQEGDRTGLDLNAVSREDLESLPGIGPVLADRIVTWREQHGRFQRVEDLLLISGIGEKRFATLKDHVYVRP